MVCCELSYAFLVQCFVCSFGRSTGEREMFSRVPELLGFKSTLWSAGGIILIGETRNIRTKTYLTAVRDERHNSLT
jgi:hypothetical protein